MYRVQSLKNILLADLVNQFSFKEMKLLPGCWHSSMRGSRFKKVKVSMHSFVPMKAKPCLKRQYLIAKELPLFCGESQPGNQILQRGVLTLTV